MAKQRDEVSKGTTYGFLAYLSWGIFPVYFHQLLPAGPWEILAHRILWTFVVCLLALLVLRRWSFIRTLLGNPRRLALISAAAFFIAVNWLVYVYAVNDGRTSEASLGYFLNPLVTIALGVFLLREKLRRLQWIAVGIGAVACLYLAFASGAFPWISLVLALSFATYGLLKKRVGANFSAFEGLAVETTVLTPFAVVALIWLGSRGDTTFTGHGVGHSLWLASAGIATAVPLLFFAAAATRIPLVTIGLLQFITPVLQLLAGVLVLGEHVTTQRWIGFGIVWLALVVLTTDSLRAHRARRRDRAARLRAAH